MLPVSTMLVHEGALTNDLLLMIIGINATDLVNAPLKPLIGLHGYCYQRLSFGYFDPVVVGSPPLEKVRSTPESCGRAPRLANQPRRGSQANKADSQPASRYVGRSCAVFLWLSPALCISARSSHAEYS